MNILEISSLFLRGYCYGYLVTSDFQNGTKMKEAYAVLLSWMASWRCCWRLGYAAYSSDAFSWVNLYVNFFSIILGSERYTSAEHVWFHQKNILLCSKEQPLAARYAHHSLPRRSCYFRWVIEWPGTTVALCQCAIVVKKENRADMPEITDERLKDGSTKNKKCSGQSVACEESQGEKKLTLEELMKLSPPGYKEFEAAAGSRDLDEETALQLWEDIFKSLDIFEMSKIA